NRGRDHGHPDRLREAAREGPNGKGAEHQDQDAPPGRRGPRETARADLRALRGESPRLRPSRPERTDGSQIRKREPTPKLVADHASGRTMRPYARIPTSTAGKSGRSLRPVSTCLVLGDDHAEVDDSPLRVGVIADAAPLRENLVELDSHGRNRRNARDAMKRADVVLRCDR